MTIRKSLIIGLLAVGFVLSPAVTNAQTVPSVTIISPNGGETLFISQPFTVRWSPTFAGTPATSTLQLTFRPVGGTGGLAFGLSDIGSYAGSFTETIPPSSFQSQVPGGAMNTGLYNLTISATVNGQTISDTSDNSFTIAESAPLTITAPNSGEVWQLDRSHSITWAPYNSGWVCGSDQPCSYRDDLAINPASTTNVYLEKLVNGNFVVVGKIVHYGKASIHTIGYLVGENQEPVLVQPDPLYPPSYWYDPPPFLANPGGYYVRIVNKMSGAWDRTDRPFTFASVDSIWANLKINGADVDGYTPIIVPKGGSNSDYSASWTSNSQEKCQLSYSFSSRPWNGNPLGPDEVTYGSLDDLPTSGSSIIRIFPFTTVQPGAYGYIFLSCPTSMAGSGIEGGGYDVTSLYYDNITSPATAGLSESNAVKVITPNNPENVNQYSPYQINWTAGNGVEKVSLALYKNGAFYRWIARDLSARISRYSWTPQATIPASEIGSNFQIYLVGFTKDRRTAGIEDKSDRPFSVVGTSIVNRIPISTVVPPSPITSTTGEIARLMQLIAQLQTQLNLLLSQRSTVTITPAISFVVTAPNGGESWQKGTIQSIEWRWTSTDVAPVEIYLHSASTSGSCPVWETCPVGAASSYLIGKVNVPTTIFKWNVGKAWDGAVIPAGPYIVQIRAPAPDGSSLWKDQSDSYFKIYDSTSTNRPPSISGVSGPTTLKIGEQGTWSVTASDPENGPLNYSVVWGDEATTGSIAGSPTVQQTATFTHSYAIAGNYTPTFTVTDNVGQSARTSLSVAVGEGTTTNNPPKILGYEYPTSASVGQEVKFTWTAIDPDGDNLAWSGGFSDLGGGVGFGGKCPSSEPRTTFSVSHTWAQAGTYTVTINVKDCRGGEDSRSIQFPVYNIPQPIPTITSSYPPNGAIDARDNSAGGFVLGSSGVTSATLIFSADVPIDDTVNNPPLGPTVFSVSSSNRDNPIKILKAVNVQSLRDVLVFLNRAIIPNERITITHKPSNSSVCLGFKPLDVDGDGRALSRDLSGLRAWVGTPTGLAQPLYKTDINRDGVFNEADMTRATELAPSTISPVLLPACPAPATGSGAFAPVSDQAQMANTLSALQSLLQNLKQFLAR